jgi:hypothetical protein
LSVKIFGWLLRWRERVATIIRRAVDALRSTESSGIAAGFLRPIDTQKIARDLDLETVGADNGRKEQPPTDSMLPDATEQKIIQRVESEWSMHGGELLNHLRSYATRLIGYSIDAEFARLQLKGKDALARLGAAHHRAEAELGHLLKAFVETRGEYERFRERHHLERPARDPARRWTIFGLLFVLIALESVLNGFFFAPGTDYGLIGGVGIAVGISSSNVGLAFALGLWPFRLINYRGMLVKLLGLILSLAGVVALLGLHAFAAHFRDATASGVEHGATAIALAKMTREPWGLADVQSAYLFLLGVVCGGFALWKGYFFDDPYPTYGAQARRLEQARATYAEEHSDLFDELDAIKEETVREIDHGVARIPLFPQQAATIRAQRAAMLQTFRAYEAAVETAANELLARYRDKNREVRTTEPPAHFSRRWPLPYRFLESAEVKELTAEPAHETPDIDQMLAQLQELSATVLMEYTALMAKYPHSTQAA